MALKQNDAEMDALLQVDGVNQESLTAQLNKIKGIDTPPPDKKAEDKKPEDKKPEDKKPEDKVVDKKPEDTKGVSDPEAIRTGILNEIFGDQFKTVEDVKKANISASLKELETLRQKNQELDALVKAKPKHQFANDDIAKMNEFVRETGIKDVNVFNKLNSSDLANMSDIDALVLNHVIENPRLASESPQEIRGYFERKYNVDASKIDPKLVESGDLTQEEFERNKREYKYNQMDMQAEADKVKAKLSELKAKIKMPEPSDEPDATTKKWTPEVETKQKAAWSTVSEAVGKEFSKIPLVPKGWKEPIANFVVPEEVKKVVLQTALDYAVSNQMEATPENIEAIAKAMYADIKESCESEIYHTIAERARSMSDEEFLKAYHNPSPKNNDAPPDAGKKDKLEEQRQEAYNLEMGIK